MQVGRRTHDETGKVDPACKKQSVENLRYYKQKGPQTHLHVYTFRILNVGEYDLIIWDEGHVLPPSSFRNSLT